MQYYETLFACYASERIWTSIRRIWSERNAWEKISLKILKTVKSRWSSLEQEANGVLAVMRSNEWAKWMRRCEYLLLNFQIGHIEIPLLVRTIDLKHNEGIHVDRLDKRLSSIRCTIKIFEQRKLPAIVTFDSNQKISNEIQLTTSWTFQRISADAFSSLWGAHSQHDGFCRGLLGRRLQSEKKPLLGVRC